MRYPTPASLISRPSYLLLLIPSIIFLHLSFQSSTLSPFDSAASSRLGGVDERVGWSDYSGPSSGSSNNIASNRNAGSSLGMKAGAALSDFGSRLGRLAGGGGSQSSGTRIAGAGTTTAASSGSSFFRRTGGSLYEVRWDGPFPQGPDD